MLGSIASPTSFTTGTATAWSSRTVVYVSHHLSEGGVQRRNGFGRLGDVGKAMPHVARILAGPVVRPASEQHLQLCPVRVDERSVLDVSQRRKQLQHPATTQHTWVTIGLRLSLGLRLRGTRGRICVTRRWDIAILRMGEYVFV